MFVVAECEASTSSWPQVLYVYDGLTRRDGAPRRVATLLTEKDGVDDRGLREISVQVNGRDAITGGFGYEKSDPNAFQSWYVEDKFTWDGKDFRRGKRQLKPIR